MDAEGEYLNLVIMSERGQLVGLAGDGVQVVLIDFLQGERLEIRELWGTERLADAGWSKKLVGTTAGSFPQSFSLQGDIRP